MTKSRGIVYSATGASFLDEAITSARSSLRYNGVPHVIRCACDPPPAVEGVVFETFVSCGNGYLDKITALERSPFDQTVYLDTDTFVVDDLAELFDLLDRFDIAATHAPGYTKCDDRGPSDAFYDFNTGVVAFRRSEAMSLFLARWYALYEAWLPAPPFPLVGEDQPAFRRALWESSLSPYAFGPEYNFRFIFPSRLVGKAKIIHGRGPDLERVAAYVNARRGPRVFPGMPQP